MHMKGHMLQLLARGDAWDHEIVQQVLEPLGKSGPYWSGTVRLTLIDLYSSGLLAATADEVDPNRTDRLRVKYALTDFGRQRMEQSGLMEAT